MCKIARGSDQNMVEPSKFGGFAENEMQNGSQSSQQSARKQSSRHQGWPDKCTRPVRNMKSERWARADGTDKRLKEETSLNVKKRKKRNSAIDLDWAAPKSTDLIRIPSCIRERSFHTSCICSEVRYTHAGSRFVKPPQPNNAARTGEQRS